MLLGEIDEGLREAQVLPAWQVVGKYSEREATPFVGDVRVDSNA